MSDHNNEKDYFERQYNARALVPEHLEIFRRWKDESARLRAEVNCHLDLAFGAGEAEKLDIFPGEGDACPLVMFVHGGYWQALDKSDHSFLVRSLVKAGISVAVNNYALAPSVDFDEIVRQNRAAMAWLWRNAERFSADPERLFASGHSAGGHMTAMLLATDWPAFSDGLPVNLVKGGLAISGIYDLVPLLPTTINVKLGLDPASAARNSPVHLRPVTRAPLRMTAGGLEPDEFHRQARLIASCWPDTPTEIFGMPGFHHFSVVEQLLDEDSALFRNMVELVRP